MLKQLYVVLCMELKNESRAMASYLKIPVSGRKRIYIPYILLKLIFFYLLKIGFIGLFVFLPYVLMAAMKGPLAFPEEGTILYMSFILNCVCGSLVHSAIFNTDEDAYCFLNTMRMSPDVFFKGKLIVRYIGDFTGFLLAFLVFRQPLGTAFYMSIWILIGRSIGEAINLYVFKYLGKSVQDISGASGIIMGVCLFFAYGFPLLRGYVVDLTKYAFNYWWLMMGLVVGSVIIYVLFFHGGYEYIARRTSHRLEKQMDEEAEENQAEMAYLLGNLDEPKDFKPFSKDNARGLSLLYKIYFARNKEFIKSGMFVRIFLIVIATIAGVVICNLSGENVRLTICNVICNCLPFMVFLMFCLSMTPNFCKSMFFHIDRKLLQARGYSTKANNYRNFLIRLRKVCVIDLVDSLIFCVAIAIVGAAAGMGNDITVLIPVFLGIIFLGLFYTMFFLTVYYLCQPYSYDMKIRNSLYYVVNAVMLLVAYGCVYVEIDNIVFVMIVGIVFSVSLSIAASLVFYKSHKTFRIQNGR